MQTSETNQLRFFKSRNHSEDSPLFRVGHFGLAANQVVKSPFSILLAQLDDGVRLLPRTWIDKPHRSHGTEGQGFPSSVRHFFDGHAAFERHKPFEVTRRHPLRRQQSVDESVVLLTRDGQI